MTRARRVPRSVPPAVLVLAVGLTTTACSLNAGSAKARQFEEDWRGTPDVESVSARGSNDLPFLGSADGTLVVRSGTSPERVGELLHELGAYTASHDHVEGELVVDEMTLGARADRDENDAVVDLWLALLDDPGVVGATLDVRETSVELDVPERFVTVTEDLLLPGGDFEPLAGARTTVTAGGLRAEAPVDVSLDAELRALRAVSDRVPVAQAKLSPTAVTLEVLTYGDVAVARDTALGESPSLRESLVVNGGKVTFDGTSSTADSTADDGLVAALDARPDVTDVVVQPRSIVVGVVDLRAADRLAQELADDRRADALDVLTLARSWTAPAAGADPGVAFRVGVAGSDPGDLSTGDVRSLTAAVPALSSVTSSAGLVDIVLDQPGERDVEVLAAELAVRVERGTDVRVRAGETFAVELTAGPHPQAEEPGYDTRIPVDGFVRAWEGAWPGP